MAFKNPTVSLIILSGLLLTGCGTTTRTTTVYSTRPPVVTSNQNIITTTKAYKNYKPRYAYAPSSNVAIQQNNIIHNKVVKNKTYNQPHTYGTHYVNPNAPHHTKKSKPSETFYPKTPSYPAQVQTPYQYEQMQLEEAKRRSHQTKAEEDRWNERLNAAEEHQMQQALLNSYETKAAEDAARAEASRQGSWLDSSAHSSKNNSIQNDNAAFVDPMPSYNVPEAHVDAAALKAEEERQMQQAIDASLQTQHAEELQRQAALQAEEERQMQQAIDASLQSKALEDSIHAQQSFAASEPQPVVLPAEAPVAPEPVAAWVPNEGMQVAAGAKLMELKNQRGGASNLSLNEMNAHLQKEMNLSESQASAVLDELGIE
ncbi:MAG: hypothetical protein ACTHJ4_04290 [Candidatus Nucleicultricaceae bacterium]